MDFLIYSEEIAEGVTGETPEGEQMELGQDVLIYLKLAAFEQGVLERLRASEDSTLRTEIDSKQGVIYLGNLDEVQKELHCQIDSLFEAIKAHRTQKEITT
jgi:hypothetical protein